MRTNDLVKTIHYTTKAQEICANLVSYIPQDVQLIEPFVGDGDLLALFPNHNWELFDIEDKGNNIVQDTLLNAPEYANKWVITNPPYLAKNKASNKTIFSKYDVDDLYKATLLSILNCDGGILIIPTNFLTDERTGAVRTKFLDQFAILEMNIFTEPVFTTTTYSVCSFAFERKQNGKMPQTFPININPAGATVNITIYPQYDYRIAGEFYNALSSTNNIFGRLVGTTSSDYITNIKLYALDTRSERIRVEYNTEHFCGKSTDRTYATFTCKHILTEDQEKYLVSEFNKQIEAFRKQYFDLSMTNYRDYNRKRIGFTFAYQLLSKIYNETYNS